MSIFAYAAEELFAWIVGQKDFVLLDVRNDKDFARFKIEGPYPIEMLNVSYYDFMEIEQEAIARVPKGKPIRIVCAKEGSAKYVGEILVAHGYTDVGYLAGGVKTWGNLLAPVELTRNEHYSLYQFIRPAKASCSYALIHGGEMMLFDPSRNLDAYFTFANRHNSMIINTFETHLQADYISGSRDLAKQSGARFFANPADFQGSKNDFISLEDGAIHHFSSGGPSVRVMFTPGHTPGSTSFIVDGRYLISGDMIFINSVGRPDLGGKAEQWAAMLFHSIQKVKQLDPELLVAPGHFMQWSEANAQLHVILPLGEILHRNKEIYGIDSEAAFTAFIKANIRPQPDEYALIRQINAHLLEESDEKQEELDLGKNECAASAYAANKHGA